MNGQHTIKICLHTNHTQMKIIMQDLLMNGQHTIKVYSHAGHTQMKIIIRDLR
jgi:hypothetical protein